MAGAAHRTGVSCAWRRIATTTMAALCWSFSLGQLRLNQNCRRRHLVRAAGEPRDARQPCKKGEQVSRVDREKTYGESTQGEPRSIAPVRIDYAVCFSWLRSCTSHESACQHSFSRARSCLTAFQDPKLSAFCLGIQRAQLLLRLLLLLDVWGLWRASLAIELNRAEHEATATAHETANARFWDTHVCGGLGGEIPNSALVSVFFDLQFVCGSYLRHPSYHANISVALFQACSSYASLKTSPRTAFFSNPIPSYP